MFFKAFILPLVTVALQALALPTKRDTFPFPAQANVTDTDSLNFALTLELLKSAFYQGGLANFTTQNFVSAGYAPGVRAWYQQISQHEQTYVSNISTLLGNQSVQACTYNLWVASIGSYEFVALSDMLEAIATSAYIGSGAHIQNKAVRVLSASILATTAQQSSWINNAVRGGNPWSNAYATPLDLNQTFTLISPYIAQCPTRPECDPLLFRAPSNSSGLFAVFLNGFPFTFAPLDNNFTVTIPPNLRGFSYVVVANSSETADDSVTIAGPAFFNFSFNANNTLITLNQ
ncbi:ferritin-like domain-containing protein [Lactarius quietus]|nr:ferritin-like domain-containing protein [Lactarius quietus]